MKLSASCYMSHLHQYVGLNVDQHLMQSVFESGRQSMLNDIITKLKSYEAAACAQIAASIPVEEASFEN